ncbi:protein kinase domain-containing protein [Streptomyces sp. NPDC003007]
MSNDGGGTGAQGRLVGGRYRLIERIGSGGMGTVWRAYDDLVQRDVAVKQPRLPGDPEDESHRRAAHRLYREARAAARVDHPAAVTIHDVVVEPERRPDARDGRIDGHRPVGRDGLHAVDAALDGLPWIVMELVQGESLHERLRRGPVDAREAARIGLAVLGALRAAHSVGIVHREVKPANVLLGPHRRVVLTDFGIAHVQGEESLTAGGEFVGSLDFVAPERMSGRIAGPASDLWSLGVLLYAAVEGASPFRRATPESVLAAIVAAEPPEPRRAGPLGPLIARLLARDPEQRPDAEEVEKALEAVAGRPPVAQQVPAAPGIGVRAGETREPAEALGTGAPPTEVREPAENPGSGAHRTEMREPAKAPGSGAPPTVTQEPAESPGTKAPPRETPQQAESPLTGAQADSTAVPLEPPKATEPSKPTEPTEPPKRHTLLRPAPLALLSALLAGGIGAATQLADTGSAESAEQTARTSPVPGAGDTWTPHREPGMAAVLHLPRPYRVLDRTGGATGRPRATLYGDERGGTIRVRLLLWDKAPGAPMDQARETPRAWGRTAHTRYAPTRVQGYDAALADTTYTSGETPRRVMRVLIRTDDDRMYELRVDMPSGTPEEKEGASLFRGARDRLGIVKG